MYEPIQVSADQILALVDLSVSAAGEPWAIDTFANPGRFGPITVTSGERTYVIGEDGRTLTDQGVEVRAVGPA